MLMTNLRPAKKGKSWYVVEKAEDELPRTMDMDDDDENEVAGPFSSETEAWDCIIAKTGRKF
jgi:hypothetical protein